MSRENSPTDFGVPDGVIQRGDVMYLTEIKLTKGFETDSENAQARFYADLIASAQTDTEGHLK